MRPDISKESDARDTLRSEIGAFDGQLFMSSLLKVSHLNLEEDLWATDGTGVDHFINNVNMKRFKVLIRNMSLMTPQQEEIVNYLTSSLQFVMFLKELKNVKPALL